MKAHSIRTFLLPLMILVNFMIQGPAGMAQQADSSSLQTDSLRVADPNVIKKYTGDLDSLLKINRFLNIKGTPIAVAVKEKNKKGKEFLFYVLGITILLLSMCKVFYAKYFNNIFKVFFNTSLRQTQLTDLLLQAKLPSLIFNIFFVVSAGLYTWLILDHYNLLKEKNNFNFIPLVVLFVLLIYSGKFLSLKLFGWMSGITLITDRYIFVIFLINKIIGILLIPFVVLLAFSPVHWMDTIIISSSMIIGILFLLRYMRTYALVQIDLKINGFHFLLYLIGMELLPILIIYKLVFRVLL